MVRAFLAVALATAVLPPPAQVVAQEGRSIDPRVFDLDLAPGPLQPGENRAVTTTDQSGNPVTGRLHMRVGDAAIVLLPDGQLVARRESQFSPTDRKFKPLDKDEMVKQLAAEFPNFKTNKTNHYIYVYNTSEEFHFGTRSILESMLPGVKNWCEGCKIKVHNPPVPLVVVMFRTEAEFRRYSRLAPGVVAYYDPVSNRVFMYEQSRLQQVRPDLALSQAISTIAHEGVHQILHNIGVQQRLSLWPMWLSEGLPEFFAPTSVTMKLKWKGPGQINDLRMYELEPFLKADLTDSAGELVEHTVIAGQLTSKGYASAWALVHYLAKEERAGLTELVREASRIQPLCGATDISSLGAVRSNRDAFTKRFGNDFKKLESKLVSYLKAQPYIRPVP